MGSAYLENWVQILIFSKNIFEPSAIAVVRKSALASFVIPKSNLSIIIMFFFNGDRAYAVINPVRPPPIINISLCNSFIIFLRNTLI